MQLGYRLKELQTDRIVIFLAYLTTDWHALTLSALQGSERLASALLALTITFVFKQLSLQVSLRNTSNHSLQLSIK